MYMYALAPAIPFPRHPQRRHPSSRSLSSTPPPRTISASFASASILKPKSAALSSILTNQQTHPLIHWPRLLQTSIASGDFNLGLSIHAHLIKLGFHQNGSFHGNNIVNFYCKFSRLDDARKKFDEMLLTDTITWTTLMKGYLDIDDVDSVLRVASDMIGCGEGFNEHTCSVVLQACKDRVSGELMHCLVLKSGFVENVFVGTSLVSMYFRIGDVNSAIKAYNSMSYKDARCLNVVISEYGKMGHAEQAFHVFLHLLASGLEPTDYTFTNTLNSCRSGLGLEVGRGLHAFAVKCGFGGRVSVANALVTMYGQYGLLDEAERIFQVIEGRTLVSWTALISVYMKNGLAEIAISRFSNMLNLAFQFDSSCLSTVLDGCSECENLQLGLQLHGLVVKLNYLHDVNVGTALIDLYAKNNNLLSARLVLNSLSCIATASFNALLVGYIHVDDCDEGDATDLFSQLRTAGMKPDAVSFARLICLSATRTCLSSGTCLHAHAVKSGFESDTAVGNSIISMYAKCGNIGGAYQMFSCMSCRDSISWNTMIHAYAIHGHGRMAIFLLGDMEKEAVNPDEITMLSVLQACSHSCLWEEGLFLFDEMTSKYGIHPTIEHFSCMVDLLGRAGKLSHAVNYINRSPFSKSPLLWRTLVHGCKVHGNLYVGKEASNRLLELEPQDAGSYILVSNLYSDGGMLEEAAKVRTTMTDRNLEKEAGSSWIEINSKIHRFLASGEGHPQYVEIIRRLDLLNTEILQEQSYESDVQFS